LDASRGCTETPITPATVARGMQPASAAFATVLVAALSSWLGAMVFWSFVATPRLFGRLGRERAGEATRVVFPGYYVLGLALSAVALGALAAWTLVEGAWRLPHRILFGLLAPLLFLALYARLVLVPDMERHRAGRAAGDEKAAKAWGRAHGISVLLNLLSMVLALGGLATVAWALV